MIIKAIISRIMDVQLEKSLLEELSDGIVSYDFMF